MADQLMWDKFAKFISSPELIKSQAERWISKQGNSENVSDVRLDVLKRELQKENTQKDRLLKAYSSGLLELGELEEPIKDVKTKIATLESQITKIETAQAKRDVVAPTLEDVERYTQKAQELLKNPSFSLKRKLLSQSLDKIVATQSELHVYGYLPLETDNINVKYTPIHRHRGSPECG